jgi:lysozyme
VTPTAPSAACYGLIKEFEQGPKGGFAPDPYRCPAGKETIGWGHVITDRDRITPPLTEADAHALLVADVARVADAVSRAVRGPLDQCRFDALVSLAYNIGIGAFLGSTLLAQLNAGCVLAAADQFKRWDKSTVHGQKVRLAGLSRRRAIEAELFLRDWGKRT